jgi:hypothetical protein
MKKLPAFLVLFLAVLMVVPSDLHAAKGRRDVNGTIFNDPNGNNKLDNKEKGGQSATVWLYRVLPNGKKRKVGKVSTDQAGNYKFNKVRSGKYFIAVRYNSNKLAVRTRTFTIGGGSNAPFNANIPYVTPSTINKYPNLTSTPNPANLDEDGTNPSTPFAP